MEGGISKPEPKQRASMYGKRICIGSVFEPHSSLYCRNKKSLREKAKRKRDTYGGNKKRKTGRDDKRGEGKV